MRSYILGRLLLAIPTLFGISAVAFLTIHLIPGNIVEVMLGTRTDVTPAQVAELNALYGIDKPLWQQYLTWAGHLIHGDLGFSLRTGLPVTSLLGPALAVTAEVTILAILIALCIALPAGTWLASRRDSASDVIGRVLSLIALSIPSFWLGTLLILVVSIYLPWLSSFAFIPFLQDPGRNLETMILPACTLALGLSAILVRMMRAAMLEVLHKDYLRTARAKGVSGSRVLGVHAMRNALLPVLTIVGLQVGYLLGGAVVVENVFTLPGVGRLVVQGIQQRDYPLVQSVVFVVAALVIVVNLVVDLAYAWVDPRIRYS
ncbi:MAG: binding-protein-dependent transport system inner rane component [Chloroflexi bacterium]|nr:binding-protein-dependent transport system inner rane component [Chloroflexota bacterium]